jgi:glycosyltransferase involved in cell wall biosynthesis
VRLLKPFGKRTLRKADVIVAVSDFEKSLIRRDFGFADERVKVIPNGVDFREFRGLRRHNGSDPTILYVGYLAEFKGAHYLVEVLPKLPSNVKLRIVGSGPMKGVMERRASELGVSDRISFYHNLSRKELLQMYAGADVFALLSRHEAYSIVVGEALAAGTPCVVARTSALTEWDDGETCLGVDFPINLNELAQKIEFLLSTKVKRQAFVKWYGKKILDWDRVAEELEKTYQA